MVSHTHSRSLTTPLNVYAHMKIICKQHIKHTLSLTLRVVYLFMTFEWNRGRTSIFEMDRNFFLFLSRPLLSLVKVAICVDVPSLVKIGDVLSMQNQFSFIWLWTAISLSGERCCPNHTHQTHQTICSTCNLLISLMCESHEKDKQDMDFYQNNANQSKKKQTI